MTKNRQFDTVGFIIDFESGTLNEEQIIAGLQHLIDDGTVWQLQGSYGRTAQQLIKAGLCTDPRDAINEGMHLIGTKFVKVV